MEFVFMDRRLSKGRHVFWLLGWSFLCRHSRRDALEYGSMNYLIKKPERFIQKLFHVCGSKYTELT